MADVRAALQGAAEYEPEPEAPTLFKVTGRGFVPLAVDAPVEPEPETAPVAMPPTDDPEADPEVVERVSRYNFDELGRILTDRIGGETSGPVSIPTGAAPATIDAIIASTTQPARGPTPVPAAPAASGALINLSGETFVLNRLPLGILVFRDQQVLFANRAHHRTDRLRDHREPARRRPRRDLSRRGQRQDAGPVNHIWCTATARWCR